MLYNFLYLNFDLYYFSTAKTKWRALISAYFRKSQRKSIRKMDFPKLLNDHFTSSFSTSTVSGGFRIGGVWPFNQEIMKEKVLCRRSLYNSSAMNK